MERFGFHVLRAVKGNRIEDIIFINCPHDNHCHLSKVEDAEGEKEEEADREKEVSATFLFC